MKRIARKPVKGEVWTIRNEPENTRIIVAVDGDTVVALGDCEPIICSMSDFECGFYAPPVDRPPLPGPKVTVVDGWVCSHGFAECECPRPPCVRARRTVTTTYEYAEDGES